MLTGTLITAGLLPIGMAKPTGEYTFAIFAVTVIALVLSWFASVYFVPHLGRCCSRNRRMCQAAVRGGFRRGVGRRGWNQHRQQRVHELFDTPFYNRFRPR
jgi:multidrug efflux pump subunit AcrB